MTSSWQTTLPLTTPALALFLLGCSEPDWTRVIGNLNYGPERTISLTAPAQVAAGKDFLVTVQTVGGTGCIRADGSEVALAGNQARLIPYDEIPLDGRGCFRNLRGYDHTTRLRFQEPGPATLRIIGYFGVPATAVLDSAEITIQVEPTP